DPDLEARVELLEHAVDAPPQDPADARDEETIDGGPRGEQREQQREPERERNRRLDGSPLARSIGRVGRAGDSMRAMETHGADAREEWRRDSYVISTDPSRLDHAVIHGYLRESYWASGIPREIMDAAIRNSLPFGLYESDAQIGFARVITD